MQVGGPVDIRPQDADIDRHALRDRERILHLRRRADILLDVVHVQRQVATDQPPDIVAVVNPDDGLVSAIDEQAAHQQEDGEQPYRQGSSQAFQHRQATSGAVASASVAGFGVVGNRNTDERIAAPPDGLYESRRLHRVAYLLP